MTLLTEIAKYIYIILYRIVYYFLSLFIRQKRYDTVIIANHVNNSFNYLQLHPNERFALITNNKRLYKLVEKQENFATYCSLNILYTIRQIMIILQSSKVVIDDYYAPLHVIDKSKEVINVWHAYAIYKKIALHAPLYNRRNPLSIKRFYNNYQRIDQLVVRSEIEKEIFIGSYRVEEDAVVIMPEMYRSTMPQGAYEKQREKILLYAPTHRPYSYDYDKVVNWLRCEFPDHYVIASYHQLTIENDFTKIRHSHQTLHSVDDILEKADIFVSDYSSLLVEVNNQCQYIQTYQIVDEKDWKQYNKIQGLNAEAYGDSIKQLFI